MGPRHDASRHQGAEGLPVSKARRLPQIHQWTGRAGRAGHQGGGVQPGAVRVPQSHPQSGQDSLLGCVTNAGVSQRCCIKDGSRPSGVCLQELAPNHPVLLRSKGVVVNVRGKGAREGRQVSVEKMSESEPTDDASSRIQGTVKTGAAQ